MRAGHCNKSVSLFDLKAVGDSDGEDNMLINEMVDTLKKNDIKVSFHNVSKSTILKGRKPWISACCLKEKIF